SRRRHTRFSRDWSSDVCSSDLWSGGNRCFACSHTFYAFTYPRHFTLAHRLATIRGGNPRLCVPVRWYVFIAKLAKVKTTRFLDRSEERRVGKERRSRGSRDEER